MKKIYLITLLFAFISLSALTAQTTKSKNDPAGKWLFEAPYAPEGFTTGTIEVTVAEKKYSTTMAFAGNTSKMAGDQVKFESDTLTFNIYVEGQAVTVKLGFLEESKMAGKAIYSEGVVPLSLTREIKK